MRQEVGRAAGPPWRANVRQHPLSSSSTSMARSGSSGTTATSGAGAPASPAPLLARSEPVAFVFPARLQGERPLRRPEGLSRLGGNRTHNNREQKEEQEHAGYRTLFLKWVTTSQRERVRKRFKTDIWGRPGTATGDAVLQIAGPRLLASENDRLRRRDAQAPDGPAQQPAHGAGSRFRRKRTRRRRSPGGGAQGIHRASTSPSALSNTREADDGVGAASSGVAGHAVYGNVVVSEHARDAVEATGQRVRVAKMHAAPP